MLPVDAQPYPLPERRDGMDLGIADAQGVVVDIGRMPIRLRTDDRSFLSVVQQRYKEFLSSEPQADIDLSFDLVWPGRVVSSADEIRVLREGPRWRAERTDFCLEWDAQSKCGKVRQSVNPYSLDASLRILHSLILADQGGFLLHAASAVRNGRAFLFFGPSGAGKTTMTRLAPPDVQLLSDEISYVRRDGAKYVAHGTPFSGELAKSGENISAPIVGFYRLVKAPANRVIPMQSADAVRALLESVLFFAEDPHLVKLVFRSVCDLVCKMPVYRLEFVADRTAWDLIE